MLRTSGNKIILHKDNFPCLIVATKNNLIQSTQSLSWASDTAHIRKNEPLELENANEREKI